LLASEGCVASLIHCGQTRKTPHQREGLSEIRAVLLFERRSEQTLLGQEVDGPHKITADRSDGLRRGFDALIDNDVSDSFADFSGF
jgi:hypothetical protein